MKVSIEYLCREIVFKPCEVSKPRQNYDVVEAHYMLCSGNSAVVTRGSSNVTSDKGTGQH